MFHLVYFLYNDAWVSDALEGDAKRICGRNMEF